MADRKITVTACGLCLVFVNEQEKRIVFGLLDNVENHVPKLIVDGVEKPNYITGRAELEVTRAEGTTVTTFDDGNYPPPDDAVLPVNREKMDFRYLVDIKNRLFGGNDLRLDSPVLVRRFSLNDGVVSAGLLFDKGHATGSGDNKPDKVQFVDEDTGDLVHEQFVAQQVLVEITLRDDDTAQITHPGLAPIPLNGTTHRIELRNGCFDDPAPPGTLGSNDFRFYYDIVQDRPKVVAQLASGPLGGQLCIPGGGGDKPPEP